MALGLPNINELAWRWRDALIYVTHGTPNEPSFSSVAVVRRLIDTPLAAIHSTHDEFVPLAEAERIVAAANQPKRLWIIKASDHRFSDNQAEFDAVCWRRSRGCAPMPGSEGIVSERLRQAIPVAIGLVMFVVALEVLRSELRAVSWHEITADVFGTPLSRLTLAVALTAVNYVALTGYDLLAFAYIGNPLPRLRIAMASFLAYAISNNVGLAMLSGASVRYRFYRRWGVTADELSRIVFSYSVTFWLGLLALGGLSLVLSPLPAARALPAHELIVPAGWLLMLVPPLYLLSTMVRRSPLRFRRFVLPMPSPAIAIGQVFLSALDWALAGAVLYVLLPASPLTFLGFLGIFLVAILLGMVSHVPGGVGVFEGLMVTLLKPYLPSSELVPALVVFRAVYYLLPFSLGLLGLVGDEVWQRRTHVARAGAAVGRATEQLTPTVLAAATFVAGVVLLFSGATPAAPGRLALLDRVLPLAVIEASHFLGSVLGAALLILSQGLARRLDAAYYLTAVAVVARHGHFAPRRASISRKRRSCSWSCWCCGGRDPRSIERPPSSTRDSHQGGWRRLPAQLARRCGWDCLRSSTWTTPHELWWQFELHG